MRPSHLDDDGAPRMVNVAAKPVMARRATAQALVRMRPDVLAALLDAGGQSSAQLRGLAAANALLAIPEGEPAGMAGARYDATLLRGIW